MDPKYWLFHPDIYPAIKDDRSPDDIEIPEGCIFHYYPGGMIAYHPIENGYRIHPHIHPKYRTYAKTYVLDSLGKMNGTIECCIPTCFRHVIVFAMQCGFKGVSTVEKAYLRNGLWYDSKLMRKQ